MQGVLLRQSNSVICHLALTGMCGIYPCSCIDVFVFKAQAGGLAAFQSNPEKLKSAVEFAAACGGFTCSKPGAIAAQPTLEEAQTLMKTAKAAV